MNERFAIIIESSNVRGQDDLPGARRDASNWVRFLSSRAGGLWANDEFVCLQKPRLSYVTALLNQHAGEYIFLAFSGHGHECVYPAPYPSVVKICLNEIENDVSASTFIPTKCATVIFDCCRGVDNATTFMANESFTCDSAIVKNAFQFRTCDNNRVLESAAFKRELLLKKNCKPVVVFSCDRGQSADEDPNAGGVYTSLFLRGARIWSSRSRVNQSKLYDVYTTRDAHDFAKGAMQTNFPQQHPQYSPLNVSYPFAIRN